MATYYDALNDFFKLNEQERLVSSAQLVYLHLLHINNCHGNNGYIQVSDRELEYRTKLNKNTITTAKQILKNRGLIDFKSEKGKPRKGTIYTLPVFILGQKLGQKPIQTLGQKVGQKLGQTLSNTPILSMDKDLRLKNKDEDKSTITTIACAGACVNRNFEDDEFGKIVDYWEQSRFGKLDFELISKLESYVKRYGLLEVKAAMDAAKASNGSSYGVSFAYFSSVLENRNKPENLPKGGEENAGTGTIERRKPKRNGNEEWRSFKV